MAKGKNSKAKHRRAKGTAGARRRGKPAAERPLTAQQERFCQEMAKGRCSQKEAAEIAGYSKNSAARRASELLDNPKVAARIRELRDAAAKEAEIEAADVIREWGRLGLSDIRDIAKVTARKVELIPSEEWSDDAARAVKKVSQRASEYGVHIDVEMHPKAGALDSLGKYLGLLVERRKHEHTGRDGGPIQVESGDEDLSALSVDELKLLRQIRDKLDAAKRDQGSEPSSA